MNNQNIYEGEDALGTYEERVYTVLDEGTYEATLVDIEEKMIQVINLDGLTEDRDIYNWVFHVDDLELRGTTSTIISSKSKAGEWCAALLGRSLNDGEVIKKKDVIGKICLAHVIQKPGKTGDIVFNNVKDILPLPKPKKVKKA